MSNTEESLLAEEEELVLETFDYDVAWDLGRILRELAHAGRMPVAIEVTHGLDTVFLSILPGATYDNTEWTKRKIASVQRFQHSSLYLALVAKRLDYDFNARFRLPDDRYIAGGGGVPLLARSAGFVGAVAVSGLVDTEDHRLIIDGLKRLKAEKNWH